MPFLPIPPPHPIEDATKGNWLHYVLEEQRTNLGEWDSPDISNNIKDQKHKMYNSETYST